MIFIYFGSWINSFEKISILILEGIRSRFLLVEFRGFLLSMIFPFDDDDCLFMIL